MLDFFWSLLGGLAARYFWSALLLSIGFVAGALMFRNNPVTGESYAQKFLLYGGIIMSKIVELKDKFITKKEN